MPAGAETGREGAWELRGSEGGKHGTRLADRSHADRGWSVGSGAQCVIETDVICFFVLFQGGNWATLGDSVAQWTVSSGAHVHHTLHT